MGFTRSDQDPDWGVNAKGELALRQGGKFKKVALVGEGEQPLTATVSDGGVVFSAGEMSIQMVRSIRVPVQRSVFASLVAGATYGQSGNTVTVAATAHGIPNTCNGMRFYWPGSAAVPADWYNNIQITSADSFTFENPNTQTIAAGTALTATLPLPTATAAKLPEKVVFKGKELYQGAQLTVEPVRWGDSTAASKWFRVTLGAGQIASAANMTSLAGGVKQALTVLVRSMTSQLGFSGADYVGGSVRYDTTVNLENQTDLEFVLYFGSNAASQFQVVESVYVTLK